MTFRYSILSTLLCVLAFSLQAQVGIGVRAGYFASNSTGSIVVNGNEIDLDYDYVSGYIVGVPIEVKVAPTFALQTEFNLFTRGYSQEITTGLGTPGLNADTKFTTLEIPILAKLGFVSDNFSLAVVFGPSFQYALSGFTEASATNSSGQTIEELVKEDIDFDAIGYEDFNRGTVHGVAGLQAGIPLGPGKLILDGRYRFGISDENGGAAIELRGRGISATAGYMFTFGNY